MTRRHPDPVEEAAVLTTARGELVASWRERWSRDEPPEIVELRYHADWGYRAVVWSGRWVTAHAVDRDEALALFGDLARRRQLYNASACLPEPVSAP